MLSVQWALSSQYLLLQLSYLFIRGCACLTSVKASLYITQINFKPYLSLSETNKLVHKHSLDWKETINQYISAHAKDKFRNVKCSVIIIGLWHYHTLSRFHKAKCVPYYRQKKRRKLVGLSHTSYQLTSPILEVGSPYFSSPEK